MKTKEEISSIYYLTDRIEKGKQIVVYGYLDSDFNFKGIHHRFYFPSGEFHSIKDYN